MSKSKINNNTLLNLNFENSFLKSLPLDPEKKNYVRQVNALLSLVTPTPILNPKLVHYSKEALELLDLDPNEINKDRKSVV